MGPEAVSLDLTTGWDARDPGDVQRLWQKAGEPEALRGLYVPALRQAVCDATVHIDRASRRPCEAS